MMPAPASIPRSGLPGWRPILRGAGMLLAAAAATAAGTGMAEAADTGERVVISRQDCRRLVPYRPAPGVAYQPGIDAEGRAVAPAELPDAAAADANAAAADQVVIDLRPPGRRHSGANVQSPALGRSDVYLGRVVVGLADGRVTLNGQSLDDPTLALVLDACARAGLR